MTADADDSDDAPDNVPGENREDFVYNLSGEAFQLAQRAAREGMRDDVVADAEAMRRRFERLQPALKSTIDGDATVRRAWSDAHLDLAYVTSRGERPTSHRLFYFLQDEASLAERGPDSDV